MNLEDVKVIIEQCQFCTSWDIDNGCIHLEARDELPISNCGCFEPGKDSKYKKGDGVQ